MKKYLIKARLNGQLIVVGIPAKDNTDAKTIFLNEYPNASIFLIKELF